MKRIIEHLKVNWIRYGFESFAVLVSILAAFALNNWNENRKALHQRDIFLKHISTNLQEDIDQLNDLFEFTEETISRSENLINSFKKQSFDEYEATVNTGWLNLEKNFMPNRSGMDGLINSGKLEILPPDLTYSLQHYYATVARINEREAISNTFIRDKYEPYFFANFTESFKTQDAYQISEMFADDTRKRTLINEDDLIDNYTLETYVLIRLVHSRLEKDLYEQLVGQANQLKQDIEDLVGK
jgi:hypothetical protein